MKALITTSGQIGPFATIARTQDNTGWLAGDCIYPAVVVGDATIGEYVAPPPPPPTVPPSVTMRQARLALLAAGKLGAVAPTINALPSPDNQRAAIDWETLTTVERSSPLVLALGAALALDSAALDALFVAAEKL